MIIFIIFTVLVLCCSVKRPQKAKKNWKFLLIWPTLYAWCGTLYIISAAAWDRLCVNVCSLGFFASRHRDQANDAKFNRRGSVRSLLDNIATDTDSNEDSKSVASMDELYVSKSKPEVSKVCRRKSTYCAHLDRISSKLYTFIRIQPLFYRYYYWRADNRFFLLWSDVN